MLRTVTKMVGHGSAPMRSATYIELAVMTTKPSSPISNARTLNCLFMSLHFLCKCIITGFVAKHQSYRMLLEVLVRCLGMNRHLWYTRGSTQ